MNILDFYLILYNSDGSIFAVHKKETGEQLPFDPITRTFEETNPLVVELRAKESATEVLDLSDGSPIPEELRRGKISSVVNEATNLISDYVWNGNYWLSDRKKTCFNVLEITKNSNLILPVDKSSNLFVHNLFCTYSIDGNWASNKYWEFNLFRISSSYGWAYLGQVDTQENWYGELNLGVNLHDDLATNGTIYYLLQVKKKGGAGNLSLAGHLDYSWAKNNDI